MDLFETAAAPIDALLFNRLVRLTAATSVLWAWIAVLTTAALSLWRIRAVHSNPRRNGPTDPVPPIKDPEVRADVPAVDDAEAESAVGCHVDRGEAVEVTKGRFTVYFDGDDVDVGDRGVGVEGGFGWMDGGDGFGWRTDGMGGWTRKDPGWYAWQDLTALDGSVVRLWDGII